MIIVLLWQLGDVILPFVLGGAIAYCLDPIADRLERLGLSRVAGGGRDHIGRNVGVYLVVFARHSDAYPANCPVN